VFLHKEIPMSLRFVLPLAAVALTLGMASETYAQDSSSTRVRPAQMPAASRCDDLLRAVEIELPNAAVRVADARKGYQEAQELCNSGRSGEGIPILREILNSVYEGG
jgi:hypothetical protein